MYVHTLRLKHVDVDDIDIRYVYLNYFKYKMTLQHRK